MVVVTQPRVSILGLVDIAIVEEGIARDVLD